VILVFKAKQVKGLRVFKVRQVFRVPKVIQEFRD
jgi:hypothetical protein